MLIIGPLMIEHRLIGRMINVFKIELEKIKNTNEINPFFVDLSVDFIKFYADQTHHGKEEDILFRDLKKKKLSNEHLKIMNELIEEHKFSRKITRELVEAKEKYIKGDSKAPNIITEKINTLINFYPIHIEKEDKHFFLPIMNYFTEEEKNAMLIESQVFDRRMIHRKYENLVSNQEIERNVKRKTDVNWIERI